MAGYGWPARHPLIKASWWRCTCPYVGAAGGPLPDHLAELTAAAVAPALLRLVVGLPDRDLLEAVPLYPAVLVGALEVRPEFRAEPVKQVKERRAV